MAKLCILTIVGDVPPDWTPPVANPPGIWGGANQPFPTPPIALPPGGGGGGSGSPPGIWGGAPIPWPTPPIYYPPSIWPSPGHPAHPIAPGGPPPGIWGGGNQPFPTPPIFLPPEGAPPKPDQPPSGTEGKWVWVPTLGWCWKPGSEDMQPHQ